MADEQNQTNPANPPLNRQVGAAVGAKEILEAVTNSQNILVALSKDPSIEELCDAFALTLALDAAGKNATAIFSGQLPEAIEFLNPEKVFETDTNSLQDFIISLNKSKADHLRYKVEGDFVRIYITPYRTMLTEQDLQFTRGEFNVDLVLALDVRTADDFDAALAAHAKIMHNARVASLVVAADANQARKFGDLIWLTQTGTLTEAVTELMESLTTERKIEPEQATALLAGLVAVSDRFGNEKTTPQVMNLAARLMSIGADQQSVMAHLAADGNEMAQPAAAAVLPVVPAEPIEVPTVAPEPTEMPTAAPLEGLLTPNESILEQNENPVGYVDQLTETVTEAPTPEPIVAAPLPTVPPVIRPGTVPTVAEIESLIKNRLPLPPEFDPKAPLAKPPTAVEPVTPPGLFGKPSAQTLEPTVDAMIDGVGLQAAAAPAAPPPANAFQIPSFN